MADEESELFRLSRQHADEESELFRLSPQHGPASLSRCAAIAEAGGGASQSRRTKNFVFYLTGDFLKWQDDCNL